MSNIVKVGIFATVALAVLGFLIVRAEDLRLFAPEGTRVPALFETVAGLDDKSAVRVAGVRVGRVDGIRLREGMAEVTLLLEQPVPLREGARARIANLGLLGDKYVELEPGPPGAPALPEGTPIPGEAAPNLDAVIGSLGDLGSSLEQTMGELTGEREAEGPLGSLIANLQATSAQLRDLIEANRAHVDATAANFERASATLASELPRLATSLEAMVAEVRTVVAENREVLAGSLQNIEALTGDVQTSVDNINQITGRIARGEGTIGKLLSSDEAHTELVSTLESVQQGVDGLSDTLGRVGKLQLGVAMEGYYLEGADTGYGAFQLDLETSTGHRYRVAAVDGATGRVRETTEVVTVIGPEGQVSETVTDTVTTEDKFTFDALFALPMESDLSIWTGLIESRFGLQLEYRPQESFWVSLEAFDFDRVGDLDPHLRFTTGWQFHRNLYLLGGYDDFLLDDGDSFFFGGGITWDDDDLKYLLGSVSGGL